MLFARMSDQSASERWKRGSFDFELAQQPLGLVAQRSGRYVAIVVAHSLSPAKLLRYPRSQRRGIGQDIWLEASSR